MFLPTWGFIYVVLPWLRIRRIKNLVRSKEACLQADIDPRDVKFHLDNVGKNQYGFRCYRYHYCVKTVAPDGVYIWDSGPEFLYLDSVEDSRKMFLLWMQHIAEKRREHKESHT